MHGVLVLANYYRFQPIAALSRLSSNLRRSRDETQHNTQYNTQDKQKSASTLRNLYAPSIAEYCRDLISRSRIEIHARLESRLRSDIRSTNCLFALSMQHALAPHPSMQQSSSVQVSNPSRRRSIHVYTIQYSILCLFLSPACLSSCASRCISQG